MDTFRVLNIGIKTLDWEEISHQLPQGNFKLDVVEFSDLAAWLTKQEDASGYDLVFMDHPEGLSALTTVIEKAGQTPVVYHTHDIVEALEAVKMGAQEFLIPSKEVNREQLVIAIVGKWMLFKQRLAQSDQQRSETMMRNYQRMFSSITNSIVRSMSMSEIDRKDILEILQQIGELMSLDICSLGFLSEDGKVARSNYFQWKTPSASDPIEAALKQENTIPLINDNWVITQLKQGQAVIVHTITDLPLQDESEREILARAGIQSTIMIPILLSNRLQGFLWLCVTSEQRTWIEAEVQIARASAEIFTALLLRWRDLTTLRRTVEALKQRNAEVNSFNQMGILLQKSRNLSQIFNVVEQYAQELFPGSVGVLQLCNQSGSQTITKTQWGEWPFSLMAEVEQLFNTLQEETRREGKKCDAEAIANRITQSSAIMRTQTHPLCLPLLAQNEIIGLLTLFFFKQSSITPAVKSLVTSFAERVTLAISNLQLREDLHYHSIRDPLTDLYNRRFMEHVFENEMNHAVRQMEPLCVIMMDIDYFKNINDTFGHEIGDLVLKAVAKFLKHHLRQEDIICRYGGDEFVIILPNTRPNDAFNRAENLRFFAEHITSDPLIKQFDIQPISLSIGIASYPMHGNEPPQLLRAADHALYDSKNHGRNQVRVAPKDKSGTLYRETRQLNGSPAAPTQNINPVPARLTLPVLVGSNNRGKLREIQAIFEEMPFYDKLEFYLPSDLGVFVDVEENGSTYQENAALKARSFFKAASVLLDPLLVLADDSGLEVHALNGEPGLHSARYSPLPNATDADRRALILTNLQDKPQPWNAHFHCTIALAEPDGNINLYEGRCDGEIIAAERGNNGFGYDPIFYLPDQQKTMAEISDEEKNRISHRALAVRALMPRVKEILDQLGK